ncbi:MAG TPA: tannase/feruloyl esterase family alpha/beta hydrolase [Vicinamibacterales bacterium]|jgi:feruloyl esterase
MTHAVTFGAILTVSLLAARLTATPPQTCESLASLKAQNMTITLAAVVPPNGFSRPAGATPAQQGPTNSVAMCRVAAILTPSPDSDIKIEVWMPVTGWNGKFQAVGNGGWAGTISYPAMSDALARGYATSSTDTGHTGDGGSFALGHPEKFADFAWRSVHEMTVRAKTIIETFYGKPPRLSYWNGCSTGGRQGLMETQRFPSDYDGIIAGASANPRSRLNAAGLAMHQALWRDSSSVIPESKYQTIHAAVLDACDARDGLKDRLIQDPAGCDFDPDMLVCKGEDGPSCLTRPQAAAVKTILTPLKTRSGVEVFPPRELGSELGWGFLFARPDPLPLVADTFRYLVYKDPQWDWRTFDLDRDLAKAEASAEIRSADAIDPNLQPFVKRRGKLLMYHGWSDALVAPRASVNYYNDVLARMGGAAKTSDWIRLFMVPGMGHCRGGDGPNTFDAVGALDEWVEHGKPPDRIVASHATNGRVDRTRPLCPYPQLAVYTGSGSADDAENFTCRAR